MKDQNGRLITGFSCLSCILTTTGGLCEEGHEFLRVCRKRNLEKTTYMIDVLVTQHAEWIADRIRRFGQATSSEVASTDHERQKGLPQKAIGLKSKRVGQKPQRICGRIRRRNALFFQSRTDSTPQRSDRRSCTAQEFNSNSRMLARRVPLCRHVFYCIASVTGGTTSQLHLLASSTRGTAPCMGPASMK